MYTEEDVLFATVESDERNSAKARKSRKRIEGRLKDRSKKRARLEKKGRKSFEPWLEDAALGDLRQQLRDIDSQHHRKSRSDRAVRQSRKMLKPVALNRLRPGVIVDAWVPYMDADDYKRRPAVVITASKWDVDIFPLTSSLGHRRLKVPIHVLENWEESGLARPSGMQQRRVTIGRNRLLGVSGELVGTDRAQFHMWVNISSRKASDALQQIAQASSKPAA